MISRSMVHLFHVAAARIETTGGDPALAKALKQAGDWDAVLKAESRYGDWRREEKRADRQRTLMALVPPSAALSRLKEAMLQRAYDLLCDGDTTACDAVLEFLPSIEAEALLNAWSSDVESDEPNRSRWHAGTARA